MAMDTDGAEVKRAAAQMLREAGFKYLAAELEHGSLAGLAALRSMTILRFLNCWVCWSIAVPPGAKLSSLPALAGNATRLVAEKISAAASRFSFDTV